MIHCMFTVLAYACATGFTLYMEDQAKRINGGKPSTPGEYMRRLARENRDQLIIFCDQTYGIFYTSEVMMLAGIRVKEPHPRAAETCEEIFARAGLNSWPG